MTVSIQCILVVFLAGVSSSLTAADIREEPIRIPEGTSGITLTGRIRGDQIVDYTLGASEGQSMSVVLETSHPASYFNVLPPGSVEAVFIGSIYGNRFEGVLPADGVYTIRVYLMRSAARRQETATYSVRVEIDPTVADGDGFERTLSMQGIEFLVTCGNRGSINTLRIVPSGLENDSSPIVRTIDGSVTGAEAADLDSDGSPEIYVYTHSAGSGTYGSVTAYAVNRRRSLSEIAIPPLDEEATAGYMGHDEFAVVETVLARRFPVYRDIDTNARPTGVTRQIQYRLASNEAGWFLTVDKVIEY